MNIIEKLCLYNTYIKIIRNVKDDNNDNIDLKIIFKNVNCNTEVSSFDTKNRYFYIEDINKSFEYYKNIELNNIIYSNFEGQLTIYLEGGGFSDSYGLEEQKDSLLHLQTINKKITETKNQLKKLKEQKTNIEFLFVL